MQWGPGWACMFYIPRGALGGARSETLEAPTSVRSTPALPEIRSIKSDAPPSPKAADAFR